MTTGFTDKGRMALSGLKVVDLSRVLGGPYCTQILADHGAEVIKVEPPQGDEVRGWGPPFHEGDASYYLGVNRNKKSIAVDLSTDEGRGILHRLLTDADVLVENFRIGTMENWGIGYDEYISHEFPKVIHCRVSGFGAEGPLGGAPGYDAIIQAMTGLMSINGREGGPPTRLGVPIVDLGCGLFATIGILMALQERTVSGKGQFVDAALYDAGLALMHPHIPNFELSGKLPVRTGNAHPNICPYDLFETSTVPIFLGVGNDAAFSRFCEELGVPELAGDERFRSNSDRVINRNRLTEILNSVLQNEDGREICDRLLRRGIPAGPVFNVSEALSHPQTDARNMRIENGWYKGAGTPIKLSRTPGEFRKKPPKKSEDASAILLAHGFSQSEIDVLLSRKIVVNDDQIAPAGVSEEK